MAHMLGRGRSLLKQCVTCSLGRDAGSLISQQTPTGNPRIPSYPLGARAAGKPFDNPRAQLMKIWPSTWILIFVLYLIALGPFLILAILG